MMADRATPHWKGVVLFANMAFALVVVVLLARIIKDDLYANYGWGRSPSRMTPKSRNVIGGRSNERQNLN